MYICVCDFFSRSAWSRACIIVNLTLDDASKMFSINQNLLRCSASPTNRRSINFGQKTNERTGLRDSIDPNLSCVVTSSEFDDSGFKFDASRSSTVCVIYLGSDGMQFMNERTDAVYCGSISLDCTCIFAACVWAK